MELIKDQLFATLETTSKRAILPNKKQILLSDTVGFLRRLPHNLVASFKSTLKEIKDSDLILKIIDITSHDIKGHIKTINNTLKELNAHKCQSIIVFNKIDLITNKNVFVKLNKEYKKPIRISAHKNLLLENLYIEIDNMMTNKNSIYNISIDHKNSHMITFVYDNSIVIKRKDSYEGINFKISCKEDEYKIILNKLKDS